MVGSSGGRRGAVSAGRRNHAGRPYGPGQTRPALVRLAFAPASGRVAVRRDRDVGEFHRRHGDAVGQPDPGRRLRLAVSGDLYLDLGGPAELAGLRVLVHHLDHPQPYAVLVAGLDRKSTRLNSSHITISYAVFCLKKKKKK